MINKIKYIFVDEKKIYFLLVFLILLLISFLEAISIGSILPILNLLISKEKTNIDFIDKIFFQDNYQTVEAITYFCVAVTSIFLLKNLLLAFFGWFKIKFSQNIARNLQIKLLRNYMSLPINIFFSNNSSILMRNINGEPKILLKMFIYPLFVLLQDLAICFGILILLFLNLTNSSLYFLAFFLFFILPFYFYSKKKLKKLSSKRLRLVGETVQYLRENIELVRDIKIYNKFKFFLDRYLKSLNKLNFVNINIGFISLLPKLVVEIVLLILGLIGIFYSVFLLNINMIEIIPSLTLIGAGLLKLFPTTIRILSQYQRIEYSKPTIDLIHNALKDSDFYKVKTNFDEKTEEFKEIELRNVSHKFEEKRILENINFKISKGDIISISGKSGEGKSTLLNILTGLIKPTYGEILINKDRYNHSNSLITNLAFVSIGNYFIDSNIVENVALKSKDDVTKDEIDYIRFLLKNVNLEEYSNNLNFNIGEKGNKLSDGQRQRLLIVRALFKKPNLLIFDEATSAIDVNNEKFILQNIYNNFPDITLIFVSHRKVELIKKYRLFKIENKKIYEEKL